MRGLGIIYNDEIAFEGQVQEVNPVKKNANPTLVFVTSLISVAHTPVGFSVGLFCACNDL